MKQFWLLPFLLGVPSMAQAKSIWHLPRGANFEISRPLKMRGDGKLAVYWSPSDDLPGFQFVQRTLLNPKNGHELQSDPVPNECFIGDGLIKEAWGARQTHAFLPYATDTGQATTWLRLKQGNSYRTLHCLPRFGDRTLQDLAFTPDGGTLYVLAQIRLWKVGAQSGRLLRVVDAPNGRWSRENAALSPDTRQIAAMRDGVTLFSTRTGQKTKRFGVALETFTGGCGSLEARVGFSPDGRHVFAQMQGDDTWVYSRQGQKIWHGPMPFDIVFTPDGRVIDTTTSRDERDKDVVLRRLDTGHISARVPGCRVNDRPEIPIAVTPDSRALFYVQNGAVCKIAWARAQRRRR